MGSLPLYHLRKPPLRICIYIYIYTHTHKYRIYMYIIYILYIYIVYYIYIVRRYIIRNKILLYTYVVAVQLLSCVQLLAISWTEAHQASMSFTISWSLPKLMSTESVMPSYRLVFCYPLLHLPSIFPSIRVFSNELLFVSGGQSIGVSASSSVLLMNIQDWFPLELIRWISFQSKGLSRVFSNTTVEKHPFFCVQPSLWSNSHIHRWLLEKP